MQSNLVCHSSIGNDSALYPQWVRAIIAETLTNTPAQTVPFFWEYNNLEFVVMLQKVKSWQNPTIFGPNFPGTFPKGIRISRCLLMWSDCIWRVWGKTTHCWFTPGFFVLVLDGAEEPLGPRSGGLKICYRFIPYNLITLRHLKLMWDHYFLLKIWRFNF